MSGVGEAVIAVEVDERVFEISIDALLELEETIERKGSIRVKGPRGAWTECPHETFAALFSAARVQRASKAEPSTGASVLDLDIEGHARRSIESGRVLLEKAREAEAAARGMIATAESVLDQIARGREGGS